MDSAFKDTVIEVFEARGVAILEDPSRFYSALTDLCEPGCPELSVLARNCDYELLQGFEKAAIHRSKEEIDDAAIAAERMLEKERFINPRVAHFICGGIADALLEHLELADASAQGNKTMRMRIGWLGKAISPLPVLRGEYEFDNDGENRMPLIVIACMAFVLAFAGVFLFASSRHKTTVVADATVRVHFVGNGETGGTMDDAVLKEGETLTLPDCSFIKGNQTFDHWQDSEYGQAFLPGDNVSVYNDKWYIAIWSEPTYLEQLRTERFDSFVDSGQTCVFLVVTSESDEMLDIGARFEFVDASGQLLGQDSMYRLEVPSGQTVVLKGELATEDAWRCSETFYDLTADRNAQSENERMYLPVEEVSCSKKSLVVQVTNESTVPIQPHIVAYGTSEEGYNYATAKYAVDGANAWLLPGESWRYRFKRRAGDSTDVYANQPWSRLDRYLFAYGEA